MSRDVPYSTFNFIVSFDELGDIGGFSEVTGLSTELNVAEYRTGADPVNHVTKVPGMHTVGDVTLKRGLINAGQLFEWISKVQTEGYAAREPQVTITMQDENHNDVIKWTLTNVLPKTFNGPGLNASGGEEVAMEELVLTAEAFKVENL